MGRSGVARPRRTGASGRTRYEANVCVLLRRSGRWLLTRPRRQRGVRAGHDRTGRRTRRAVVGPGRLRGDRAAGGPRGDRARPDRRAAALPVQRALSRARPTSRCSPSPTPASCPAGASRGWPIPTSSAPSAGGRSTSWRPPTTARPGCRRCCGGRGAARPGSAGPDPELRQPAMTRSRTVSGRSRSLATASSANGPATSVIT